MTQSLSAPYRDASYNHKKGWSTTAQPYSRLTVGDYHQIASLSQNDVRKKSQQFMDKNDFSYIEISHEEFLSFEKGRDNFRQWLDNVCKERGVSSRADFLIVGPRVKTRESGDRKTIDDGTDPDRIVDYSGVMFVALKQHPKAPKNKDSLNTLVKAINSIESDDETLAHKNLFWRPHQITKFRGHYSLWTVKAAAKEPEDKVYEDYDILTEVKIEHESQMDADKLTRRFLNIGRAAKGAQAQFSSNAKNLGKRSYKQAVIEQQKDQAITALGATIYNRVFTDAGLVRLMDPKLYGAFAALSTKAILATAKETVKEHFKPSVARELISTISNMSMFDDLPKPSRPSPKSSKS